MDGGEAAVQEEGRAALDLEGAERRRATGDELEGHGLVERAATFLWNATGVVAEMAEALLGELAAVRLPCSPCPGRAEVVVARGDEAELEAQRSRPGVSTTESAMMYWTELFGR